MAVKKRMKGTVAIMYELFALSLQRRFAREDLCAVAGQLSSLMLDNAQRRLFGSRWAAIQESNPQGNGQILQFCWDALPHLDLKSSIPWRTQIDKNVWIIVIETAESKQQYTHSSRARRSLDEATTAKPHGPRQLNQPQSTSGGIEALLSNITRAFARWIHRVLGNPTDD